jgi:pimeloyl-ACP methyl ester carboxylesterase
MKDDAATGVLCQHDGMRDAMGNEAVVVTELTVQADDGRVLEVQAAGPPGSLPLLFHHGTPGAAEFYPPMLAAAVRRGLRLVIYARPGYGGSSPAPGRRVADAAADVAAILNELGEQQFVTMGWSGGGPHALACARLLPGRCLAAATMGGPAPHAAEGLDWLAGMADDSVTEFTAALHGETELTELLTAMAPILQQLTAEQLVDGLGDLVSAADKALLRGEPAEYLAATFRSGLQPGIEGWRDDDLAFVRDWGLALDGGAPVTIWQGDEDRMVPVAHATWLAAHLPAARIHVMPGAGHLSLPIDNALDELIELAGR